MPSNRLKKVLRYLHQKLRAEAEGGATDGQLLACFVASRDEHAFEALVRRHGPMVMGVCRRILRHQQDAEDAFQATFLILARKADAVLKREAVGSFLYGVAYRTALAARARNVRLRSREKQVESMPHPEVPPTEVHDWKPYLDQELSRLSKHYRTAIVLCDLEGCSRREAARQLGVPPGTLSCWLHRARVLLAKRLGRYRLVLPGGALAVAMGGGSATAAVPSGLVASVVHGAALVAAGQSAGIAAPTALLMKEVLGAMLMTKLKGYVAAALVALLLGVGLLSYRAVGQGRSATKAAEARPLSDLEELRREVEILKLQVGLLQDRVKSQAVEIKSLKEGRATMPPVGNTTSAPVGGTSSNRTTTGRPGANKTPSSADPTAPIPDPKSPPQTSNGTTAAPSVAPPPPANTTSSGNFTQPAVTPRPVTTENRAVTTHSQDPFGTVERPKAESDSPEMQEIAVALRGLHTFAPGSDEYRWALKTLEGAVQKLKQKKTTNTPPAK